MNIIEKQGAVTRLATAIQNRMLKDVGPLVSDDLPSGSDSHRELDNQLFLWPFSRVMLVITRG